MVNFVTSKSWWKWGQPSGSVASHVSNSVGCSASDLVPDTMLGKAAKDGPGVWATVGHIENPNGVPASLLQPGRDEAMEAVWRMSQQMEDLHFCLLTL